ncbi:MAG: D-alanyl-D-alanine carboxypeptidase [Candidatus Pacebacteria bacterium]|nr:D-alanyl-D-alanine carboxypeptidase [Candidatus Paceibacterota bacterium]
MENNEEIKNYRLFALVIIIVIVEAVFFSVGNSKINNAIRAEEERYAKLQTDLQNLPLEAKAVSVYNITQNKKIYGLNDTAPLPLASLAKTMTVVTALNNHKLNDIVFIPLAAISQAGDYGLYGDEKWYMADLAKSTLIASANDGAYALTAGNPNFLEEMNTKAKKIGMEHTLFLNPTGLDIDLNNAGGFTSAEDANTMAMYALRRFPQIFEVTTTAELKIISLSLFDHDFKNTNILIGKIPNLLFSKTGFTEIAGGNLTIIFKNNRAEDIAITVLGSTFEGRFTDMEKIVNIVL